MKILKVILLLVLISKNALGLSIDIGLSSGSNCCNETVTTSMTSSSSSSLSCVQAGQDEEEKSNCCNVVCDCICCGHIFTFNTTTVKTRLAPAKIVAKELNIYSFIYARNFISGIWQPPRQAS